MKILMISTDRDLFDPNSSVSKRIKEYSGFCEKLDVIVFTLAGFEKQSRGNITIYPTNSSSRLSYVSDAISIGRSLSDIQIVTTQDPFETGLVGKDIANFCKAKFHIQIHTDIFSPYFSKHSILNRLRVIIAKSILDRADSIRVVSKRIKDDLERIGISTPIKIIPISIEANNNLDESEVNLSEFSNKKYILSVSRLSKEKDYKTAIKAFAEISKNTAEEIYYLIIGDGVMDQKIKNWARTYGVSDKVKLLGKINNIKPYLEKAFIFLHTSKYEGYGMALIEAAKEGLPIISTDVGIVRDVFIDLESALVCAVGDYRCLAKAGVSLIEDSKLRNFISQNAKNKALNHIMSKEEFLDAIKSQYESLL